MCSVGTHTLAHKDQIAGTQHLHTLPIILNPFPFICFLKFLWTEDSVGVKKDTINVSKYVEYVQQFAIDNKEKYYLIIKNNIKYYNIRVCEH